MTVQRKEKDALSAIKKKKKKFQNSKIFVSVDNVKMTIANKVHQNILLKCPVAGCQAQEHGLKRHLIRKKHRWTEKEAARHVSFCTRMYKYITKFVKDGTMVPRFCIECDAFFARIDNHLSFAHKLEKSDIKYSQLKDHLKEETALFTCTTRF